MLQTSLYTTVVMNKVAQPFVDLNFQILMIQIHRASVLREMAAPAMFNYIVDKSTFRVVL